VVCASPRLASPRLASASPPRPHLSVLRYARDPCCACVPRPLGQRAAVCRGVTKAALPARTLRAHPSHVWCGRYNLFSRVDNGLAPIAAGVQSQVQEAGARAPVVRARPSCPKATSGWRLLRLLSVVHLRAAPTRGPSPVCFGGVYALVPRVPVCPCRRPCPGLEIVRQREAATASGGKENPADPAFVQSLIALYDQSKAVRAVLTRVGAEGTVCARCLGC
jgi:hypothetical protein